MESTCFVMKIKKDKLKDYIHIHKKGQVWQEVLDNLKNAGIEKMKIYMLKNYAIVYAESRDIKQSFDYLGQQESQNRWNQATEAFMDTQPQYGQEKPVENLECVFDFVEGKQVN